MSWAATRSTPIAKASATNGTTTQAHSRRLKTNRQISQLSGIDRDQVGEDDLAARNCELGIVMPEASSSKSRESLGSLAPSRQSATLGQAVQLGFGRHPGQSGPRSTRVGHVAATRHGSRAQPGPRRQAGVAAHDSIPAQVCGEQTASLCGGCRVDTLRTRLRRRSALPAAAARPGGPAYRGPARRAEPRRWG